MNIFIYSKNLQSAASLVLHETLGKNLINDGYKVFYGLPKNVEQFDLAICLSNSDVISMLKKKYPKLKIGVFDAKHFRLDEVIDADFCIVSSIEQREFFLKYNKNIFIYYMIPCIDFKKIYHKKKELVRIFYHGNKIHLNASFNTLSVALNELGKKYLIEFNAIYNIKDLGLWRIGTPNPKNCPVNHIQWYPNCYLELFKNADIGVVPNYIPFKNERFLKWISGVSKRFLLENQSDYLIKFKESTNAGRALVFGLFGIPVVAEAVPSVGQLVQDNFSGNLVMSSAGWYLALESLIIDHKLRQRYGHNLYQTCTVNYNTKNTTKSLMKFILQVGNKKIPTLERQKPKIFLEYYNEAIQKIKKRIFL